MLKRSNKFSKPTSESGFSLIEVMIAVAIFLVVMAAIFGVLRIGLITRDSITGRSEMIANARTAVNAVGREAVNAGLGFSRVGAIVPDDFANDLLAIPTDSGIERDLFTGVMAGDEINQSLLSLSGEKNDLVAFIYRDLNFNSGDSILINGTQPGQNYVVLDTGVDGCVTCNKYDLYLVESADGDQALAMATDIVSNRYVHLAWGDPLGLNRRVVGQPAKRSILTQCLIGETANCFNYTPSATAKRIFLSSYSVDADGTLIRTVYGNNTGESATNQTQIQPLSYGVQRFQVKYLMQDGMKVDDPSEGNTNQSGMNEVVQVEIKITIRAEGSQQGITSTQLINLTSTFSTRNLRYDNE